MLKTGTKKIQDEPKIKKSEKITMGLTGFEPGPWVAVLTKNH